MSSKSPWAPALFAVTVATSAAAQVTTVVANVGYQSPRLVAPAILLYRLAGSGRDAWTLAVVGATVSAEHSRNASPVLATVVRAEVAVFNANSSDYIYRNGQRDTAGAFRDRSVRLSAGLRRQQGRYWRTDVRAIGLYEAVAGLADAAVTARWREPYLGLSVETNYQRVIADDVFQGRWDGLKMSGSVVGFLGARAWWKSQLAMGAGKTLGRGRVNLRARAWVLLGDNLDLVNQHLVGGCWDLAAGPALYGYHYAEFRIRRALVLGGGADVRFAGTWELGLRVGYLNGPSQVTYGEAVRLSTVWQGIGIQAGVGFPRAGFLHRKPAEPLLFAAVTAGVL